MTHFNDRMKEIGATPRPRRAAAAEKRAIAREQFHPYTWASEAVRDARKRAKKRGIACTITAPWVLALLSSQDWRCAMSGIAFGARRPRPESHKRPYMPSLDRIDCSAGYVPGNVRIVCVAVNTLLQDWGDEVYRAIVGVERP